MLIFLAVLIVTHYLSPLHVGLERDREQVDVHGETSVLIHTEGYGRRYLINHHIAR